LDGVISATCTRSPGMTRRLRLAFVNVVIIGRSSAAGMMQEEWYNGVYGHFGQEGSFPEMGGVFV